MGLFDKIFGTRAPVDPHREELRRDFSRVTKMLRTSDPMIQKAVGHSINMANSLFMQRFGSLAGFRRLQKLEKLNYIQSLTTMEEKMAIEQPHASIGFALFKMWVAVLTENDEELIREFSCGLAEFSRKAA